MEALAGFFNRYFKPVVPVVPTHLATAPGAAASLDALLYNICEPMDGVLVPGPFWSKSDAVQANHTALKLPRAQMGLTGCSPFDQESSQSP